MNTLSYLIMNRYALIKISVIGIVLLCIIWFIWNRWDVGFNKCNYDGKTSYFIHEDEICPDVSYYVYPEDKVRHILWTGGYDSTFLLCYYFVIRNEPVQPIYLMCGYMDSRLGIEGRKNQKQELKAMKKIRKMLIHKYPYKKNRLLPTYYVTAIKSNKDISKKFDRLYRRYDFFSRDVNQYERIARFSKEWKQPLYIGLEKCGTGLDAATVSFRINEGTDECSLVDVHYMPKGYKELDIFQNLRFSVVHLTKRDMKEISLDSKNYFYDCLVQSFSCWYPGDDDSPCGKCPMCLQRII